MKHLMVLIKPDGTWLEDAWHFLMVALDERVLSIERGQRDKGEASVMQYCGYVLQALDYLRTYPNSKYREELRQRVLAETLPAQKRIFSRFLPKAEKERLLEAIASIRNEVSKL
jgi:hypothetical protein